MSYPNVPGVDYEERDQAITPDTSVVALKMAAVIANSWGPTELTWVEKPVDLKNIYTHNGVPSIDDDNWYYAWYLLNKGIPLYLKRAIPDDILCADVVVVHDVAAISEITNLVFASDLGADNANYSGKYVDLYVGAALHRFWWNIEYVSIEPAAGGGTLHEVLIEDDSTATEIADATAEAIDDVTGLSTNYTSGATFRVTHQAGAITDSTTNSSAVTDTIFQQGVNASSNGNEPDGVGCDWEDETYSFSDNQLFLIKTNPGSKGNDFGIKITNVDDDEYTFDIEIYLLSGVTYELQRTVTVSRKRQLDGYGNQLYLEERIKVYNLPFTIVDNTALADTVLPHEDLSVVAFEDGDDGTAVSAANIVTGWQDIQYSPETWRVALTFGWSTAVVANAVKALTSRLVRKYTTAQVDSPNDTKANVLVWNTALAWNDSRVGKYCEYSKQTDEFNGGQKIIPPSVIAGLLIGRNREANPFKPFAGIRRGTFTSEGLSQNFSEAEMDDLLGAQVNPLGIVGGAYALVDNLTAQTYKSPLSNMNTRFLFDQIGEVSENFLLAYVQEYNDEDTRGAIQTGIQAYLDRLKMDGSLVDGLCVCDESNNTPAVIDAEELICDVYLQPPRAAKKIKLRLTAVGSSVDLQELA